MLFEIVHRTEYRYSNPASEAYIEARLSPPKLDSQSILQHSIEVQPDRPTSTYEDYFGNQVTFYSMTLRHERLTITNRATVKTQPVPLPHDSLSVSVAEARQIFSSKLADVFDYLQPTPSVPIGGAAKEWTAKYFPSDAPLEQALSEVNRAIYEKFRYKPGATDISTPLALVWKQKAGVCQDFSHVLLSILRTAGIPGRYVCGYIESDPPPGGTSLVGSIATHAWVEALTPGMHWVALDPTNNQWCGPRHVTMSYGRDFEDASPVRGTFKGSGTQSMKVRVTMKRLPEKP